MPRKKLSLSTLEQSYKLHNRALCYLALTYVQDLVKAKRIVKDVFIELSQNGGGFRTKTEIQEFLYDKTLEACTSLKDEHELKRAVVSEILYSGRLSERNREEGMIEAEVLQALH